MCKKHEAKETLTIQAYSASILMQIVKPSKSGSPYRSGSRKEYRAAEDLQYENIVDRFAHVWIGWWYLFAFDVACLRTS